MICGQPLIRSSSSADHNSASLTGIWHFGNAGTRARVNIWPAPSRGASRSSETEQLRRVVDQHAVPRVLVDGNRGDQIDQVAVIGHAMVVGVRPVGAPYHTLGRMLGEIARQSDRVAERRRLLGDAVGAAELDP